MAAVLAEVLAEVPLSCSTAPLVMSTIYLLRAQVVPTNTGVGNARRFASAALIHSTVLHHIDFFSSLLGTQPSTTYGDLLPNLKVAFGLICIAAIFWSL